MTFRTSIFPLLGIEPSINLDDITASVRNNWPDDGDVTALSLQLSLKRKGSKEGQKAERKAPQTPVEVSHQLHYRSKPQQIYLIIKLFSN